ncbi:MAG: GMC family oxidoreductase [Chroococcidiopsidaceae cyanobacterium CP_BM_RX_35]|nr:GMC family oxidoreductase [Chroococcidiopsidaceae cyanobacterium CP_BM_RX_35]
MDKVDVVIVGSGASGSILAAKLAEAGKRVVVLEGGPKRQVSDLYSSQIWARRIKWFGPNTQTEGPEPLSVHFGSGWGTGGAALHHYAVWLRRHADDFNMRSQFGEGLDWPFSYEDLQPYYDSIQEEVGISGDAKAEIWRPTGTPYPMPPRPLFQQATLIAEGFTKLGLRTSPLPMAINSVEYKGRPACVNDGWCDAGCPILALVNPLAVYLPMAEKAGAELRHESYVTRILQERRTRRATGVEYYDSRGQRRVQRADVVIVAAYTFQTPRLLLNSATRDQPQGMANSSGLVGCYMMTHSSANIFGMFRDETENFRGTVGGQLLSQDAYAKDPDRGYINSSQWLIANAMKPNDLLGVANSRPDLFGNNLHRFLETASHHLGTMTFVGEDLPNPENRLTLDPAQRDRYGYPLARVTHSFGESELKCYNAGIAQGEEIFKAAGAYEVWAGSRVHMHAMGGVIMGSDPESSVTNGYGQTHDIPNLFVAGPSLFPTSAAVNPCFTIHAVALRAAEYLTANWSVIA